MSDKKHIDRLFQESFKDFEATPSDAVWENIEKQLNHKEKKRRVIPIWWRYAGVAALLLLLLTIGINNINTDDNTQKNQIVDTEGNTPVEQNNKSDNFDELIKADEIIIDNNTSNDNSNQIHEAVANTNSDENKVEQNPQINQKIISNNIKVSKESSIAETSSSQNENESRHNTNSTSNKKLNDFNLTKEVENKTTVASNNSEEKSQKKSSQIEETELLIDKNKATDFLNPDSKNTGITKNNTSENEIENETAISENKEDGALSIEDAIDKTKDIIEEEKFNRWSIAPNAAPVYFNTLGEGSSIDPQFNNNSKSGELNMSYGISASYAVTKKLSIRSGINKVNLGYNTNNVIVFQSVGVGLNSRSSDLQNVDISSNGNTSFDALNSSGGIENLSIISGNGLSAKSSPESFSSNTSINQALGYIEVPLEIQYNILDKKFAIHVIGGFSSFFLSDNEIFSETEGGSRILIGEANNINKISYSANFGLGLNYEISKKIDLNLEPMFKYQINTFNNTSGDFQPFFIGVYTGFAIKF